MSLKNDILQAAKSKGSNPKGLDPYTDPFKPSDLGLNSSKYGSFSDHCVNGTTVSSKHSTDQCLIPIFDDISNKPKKYLLR